MADPTQTNISQTTIPDYAKPYVETLLGKAQTLTTDNPYKAYPGERTAGFTDLQNQAFKGVGQLGPASQLTDATSMAQKAGLGALGVQYNPSTYGNVYNYNPQQVGTQSFLGQGTAASYMNPYMQNVVDIQKREAQRLSDIAGTQQQAQATQSGAFGGARDAIMRAERERNLATQMGDIQATGSNAAYNQAMQQFNAEQAARMQAAMANQQAGLTSAQTGAQYGQAANQLNEQSRQFGAGLGLQGLQTALQGAGALGNLGATQFGQQTDVLGLQGQMGGVQQQQQQNVLNQQYQDFLNQKQYPYQQLGFMSDMLRGLPLSQTSTAMYQNPSTLSQVAGLGTAAAGAYGMYKGLGKAKGGTIKEEKKRPAGLAELAVYNMA